MDPILEVYNTLWDMAEDNSALTNLIKVGNREKYDRWSGFKEVLTDADTPELALLIDGGVRLELIHNSSQSNFVKSYQWVITTGELAIPSYTPILWELLRAMCCWQKKLCPLVWNTCEYVQRVELVGLTEGTRELDITGALSNRGWASMLGVNVIMSFPTQVLQMGICDS